VPRPSLSTTRPEHDERIVPGSLAGEAHLVADDDHLRVQRARRLVAAGGQERFPSPEKPEPIKIAGKDYAALLKMPGEKTPP
jgi:hypothetical protein